MAHVLLKVMFDDPPSLRSVVSGVPASLDIIAGKCLNKEPAQRYETAQELADDLERFLGKRQIIGKRLSLLYRLRARAQRNKPLVVVGMALFLSLLFLAGYGVRTRIQSLQKERQARQQAEIAQQLGQEITNMDWLLRSARQIPLHDLGREKAIMRTRMAQLQEELHSYGELSRGLGHYALGRGHMALHEYPEALAQLQQSLQHGNQRAEVYYAFGFVLGKHYEQAMYEARLAGGGEWAKKQLKEIEPKYLTPAIDALQRSREMKLDAPEYLEGLIAYYRGEYEAAIKHGEVALQEAPWLYEASKLKGDVHLQRGLEAMDQAKFEEAEKQLREAVQGYESAARIGQSDAEVYEGLAEAWVRLTSVAQQTGKPTKTAYTAAMSAADKINTAEPQSTVGPLKKAYLTTMVMEAVDPVLTLSESAKQCLSNAERVLAKQPGNPYATELQSSCLSAAAFDAFQHGADPEPLYRRAIGVLQPVLEKDPYFLLGWKNMGVRYMGLSANLYLHGRPDARPMMEKALEYLKKASAIDITDASSIGYALDTRTKLVMMLRKAEDLAPLLAHADEELVRCGELIGQHISCDGNRLVIYARAAFRAHLAGENLQPYIARAKESTAVLRKLKLDYGETEQAVVLWNYVAVAAKVRAQQDPSEAQAAFAEALQHCLALDAKDAQCPSLAAQAEWAESEWNADKSKLANTALKRALQNATTAAQNPPKGYDVWSALSEQNAWPVLAETNLRLGRLAKARSKARDKRIAAGLLALEKTFAINPHHAAGRATKGALLLLRAEGEREEEEREASAKAAIKAFEEALAGDPFLRNDYAAELTAAKALTAAK